MLDLGSGGVWESTNKFSDKSVKGNDPFCKKCVFALEIEKVPRNGRNSAKTNFRGPKCPPEVTVHDKTCSTICGTYVHYRAR